MDCLFVIVIIQIVRSIKVRFIGCEVDKMEISKAKEILNSYDFDEMAEFANGEMQQAIDTVLKELDRLQIENKELEDLVRDLNAMY